MSKWSRDMACAARLSWARRVQHAEHAVFCHLLDEGLEQRLSPESSPMAQGISWLNRPTHTPTHTHPTLTGTIQNCQILTRSSYITEPSLWAWIKDSDHCFVILAEPTKGTMRSLNHKRSRRCAVKQNPSQRHSDLMFTRAISTVKSFFQLYFFCAITRR